VIRKIYKGAAVVQQIQTKSKSPLSSQQQLDELKSAIAAIQQEISVAKEERKVAKETLEKAIAEEKPTCPFEKHLESAQAELRQALHLLHVQPPTHAD
jgi:predicted  nucleic acid-binding Zn-ribbon protein